MKIGEAILKRHPSICIRCDKCNSILINGTINLLNTRIQDATCDTCMMIDAEEESQSKWDYSASLEYIHHSIQEAMNGDLSLLDTALEKVEDIRNRNYQSDVEVVSREGVKEIEDRFKSDMRVIKVITNIIK